jgi:glycine/D-amino acid oxidase-like deaminating enzyme
LKTADVVVIGGGIVGASVAWHLAARGCSDVLVLERAAEPGLGSTGRATGGFRAQFGSEVNVRLSLLAREKLLRFGDEVGADPGYRPHGYLFLADRPETLDLLRALQATQRRAGLHEARGVDAAQAREINPAVRADVLGGVFCPTDGFIRPLEILRGYVEGARRFGVRFEHGAPVVGMRRDGDGRVAAVQTPGGEVAAGVVVDAAGAWAGEVARMAGVEIPVRPLRRQVALTRPFAGLPEEMPLTVFVDSGLQLRVRDGRALLLWGDGPPTADPFDTTFDAGWLPTALGHAHHDVPCLREATIDPEECWAGLYEMSPDRHALLGRAPGVENLFLANGSSGHGVMHSPALGHLLAEIILDGRAATLDVHALRPERFAEGRPNEATEIL